ncbi:FAD-dependent oxidoreductase [Saccharospirillum sp. MSK14-1]|uniref:D-amino acid dehydrogenase n=1 Tax=Saccharospirillum sp. MSK14-1 TaxID=1897632 RepID=UPI000D372AD8|nr:D-amino acid dehydrogenase [Saccharospirillum sp. MSK14-1]PTY38682.1 FAD-dependent oxidoreductase [Saccharospirillum sp. MSK14-1]
MKVVVIGAGVTGVTLAWELCQRGHDVTVIEALSESGLETSRANAAQRSYGAVYPWASPALMTLALRTLFSKRGAFKLALPPSPETIAFLLRTLKNAVTPGRFDANREAMLRLAEDSRLRFLELQDQLGEALVFDGEHEGVLELASTHQERERLGGDTAMLTRLGIEHELLDAEGVRRYEPALANDAPLAGGLRLSTDGTGDCHQFTQSLAAAAAAAGVTFRYNQAVTELGVENNRVTSVLLDSNERLSTDAVALCAGFASRVLARSVGLAAPIYPVKGYSMTLPLIDAQHGPRSTVLDDRYKVVCTRLGDRVRVSGFVELAGLDRHLPPARFEVLQQALHSRFPGATAGQVEQAWAGFRPMTPDGPPLLGASPDGRLPNLFFNTGHGTFGWTLSAGSAQWVARLMDGDALPDYVKGFQVGR